MEILWYMTRAISGHGQRFDWREFVERVSEIEGTGSADPAYHAQFVVDPVGSIVTPANLQQLRDQFPESADDENGGNSMASSTAAGGVMNINTQTRPVPRVVVCPLFTSHSVFGRVGHETWTMVRRDSEVSRCQSVGAVGLRNVNTFHKS